LLHIATGDEQKRCQKSYYLLAFSHKDTHITILAKRELQLQQWFQSSSSIRTLAVSYLQIDLLLVRRRVCGGNAVAIVTMTIGMYFWKSEKLRYLIFKF
jgi:hypothetical protein